MEYSVTALETRGITLYLGGVRILEGVTVAFESGSLTGLIGPNGSGKTSLLKTMDGILHQAKGSVFVGGRNMQELASRERGREIAVMLQEDDDMVGLPVIDVVLAGRFAHTGVLGPETDADSNRARRLLASVGLGRFAERRFHTLSTGERQLVRFCRAVMQDARVVLLDEPTSNLDLGHQEQIFDRARALAANGVTVVMAMHNLNDAARVCDRLAVMSAGRLVAHGPPREVLTTELLRAHWRVNARVENLSVVMGSAR